MDERLNLVRKAVRRKPGAFELLMEQEKEYLYKNGFSLLQRRADGPGYSSRNCCKSLCWYQQTEKAGIFPDLADQDPDQ